VPAPSAWAWLSPIARSARKLRRSRLEAVSERGSRARVKRVAGRRRLPHVRRQERRCAIKTDGTRPRRESHLHDRGPGARRRAYFSCRLHPLVAGRDDARPLQATPNLERLATYVEDTGEVRWVLEWALERDIPSRVIGQPAGVDVLWAIEGARSRSPRDQRILGERAHPERGRPVSGDRNALPRAVAAL